MNYALAVAVLLIGIFILDSCGLNEQPYYQVNSLATMNRSCVADAQSQLSPQWGQANRLDRAMTAWKVILACEE